jgi:hypothetical protein
MDARLVVTSLGTALLLIACGGASDTTSTAAQDLSRQHDGGKRMCRTLDGGQSPCARGQGDDDGGDLEDDDAAEPGDQGDDDGGDPGDDNGDDGGGRGHGHAPGGGKNKG